MRIMPDPPRPHLCPSSLGRSVIARVNTASVDKPCSSTARTRTDSEFWVGVIVVAATRFDPEIAKLALSVEPSPLTKE